MTKIREDVTTKIVRSRLQIHVAVLLFGLAGLFGKLLTLSPFIIVAGRTLFAAAALLIYAKLQHIGLASRFRLILVFVLLGGLLAFHWVAFFRAIQLSTVAIGLLTFSSFPLFVTILEPRFFGTRINTKDVIAVLVIIAGLILVMPAFHFGRQDTQGAVWGVFSGLSFAILQMANRKIVQRTSPIQLAFYQNGFACLFLLPFCSFGQCQPDLRQWLLLLILGVLCTAVAHTLFIQGLRRVTTQWASLISTLEPVYGIALAALLLHEIPSLRTLAGGLIILGTTAFISFQRN